MSSATTAVFASNFINSIGVNTHLDFSRGSYANTQLVETEVEYLGVKNLRDSPSNPADVGASGLWQQVANATGVKFDAYLPEGSVAGMQQALARIVTLAGQGIVSYIEGGNEEDQSYAVGLGNSLATTAQFQQQVYATGHQLGIPVINMSFGTGWSSSTTGDYGTVGNLAAYADYANAHTYFGTGNPPSGQINFINSAAGLAATGRPVITTEMGWYTDGTINLSSVSETVQAKYMLDGLFDAYQAGDVKTYLYELMDEHASTSTEDNFGLFHADGTAKLAAVALHNLTTLLADTGSAATAGSLAYSLAGLKSTDHSMLLEKSDGSFWLAIWNEARLSGPTQVVDLSVAAHTLTLSLDKTATQIAIFDPLTGTTAIQTASNTGSMSISLPDHPILVEITTGAGTASATDAMPAGTNSMDIAVAAPSSAMVPSGQTAVLSGIAIADAWAASHSGNMTVNLSVTQGSLTLSDTSGAVISGSGSAALHLTGSLAQINADLTDLHFSAPSGGNGALLTIQAWNQAGSSTSDYLVIANGYTLNADEANLARLYQAAFGRIPDSAGLAAWANVYAGVPQAAKTQGATYALAETSGGFNGSESIAQAFTTSPEFQQRYGAVDNHAFINLLYENTLHRPADAAGLAAWEAVIDSGAQTREMLLVGFAESPENVQTCAGWLTVA